MAEAARAAAASDEQDRRSPQDIARYWQQQIELAEKDHRSWRDDGKKVVERYKAEKDKTRPGKRFNILYSNTELLLAALYGQSAKPDVRRRFQNTDPIGQSAAELIEQALVYCNESYDVDKPIEAALKDYLLPGRGVVRVEYIPVFDRSGKTIVDQILRESYVYWEDFLCMPARTWADIEKNGWVSFRQTMTRDELVANFGEDIGNDAPLNWAPDILDRKNLPDQLKKAEVFEIWDITDRNRTWIVKGYPKPLRIDSDPYGLERFFPLPEPIAYYATTDTIVPEPEFHVYKDQADDLDEITNRISRLTRALKRRGVYDQSVKELARLATANDNQFLPVENYAALATKGGLAAAFQTEDISVIAGVLGELYKQRDMLVQAIWELVGLADIMRGSADPNETLGAQQLKAQFGSQRIKRRQRSIQKWIRDLLRIKAEIIAEHFQPDVLMQMTGQQIDPRVMQVLRTDKLRGYRIDIETDSTIFQDAESEKKSRSEMLQGVTAFMQGWAPIVEQKPSLAGLAFEFLKFGLGGFKSTRSIDDAIEQASMQIEQQAMQPPRPTPEQQKAQADLQMKQQDMQFEAQKHQQSMAFEQQKHEQSMGLEREKMALEREKMANQVNMEQMKAALHREVESAKLQSNADLENKRIEYTRPKVDMQVTAEEVAGALGKVIPDIERLLTTQQQEMQQLSGALGVGLQAIAQSQQQLAAALATPRRRVLVRGPDGRATHAEDVPMTVQ